MSRTSARRRPPSAGRAGAPRLSLVHPPVRLLQAAPLAAIAAVLLVFALVEALHVRGFSYATWNGTKWSDYDEGVYLVSARLLNQGFPLFSSVFSSQPALFLPGLALVLRAFGDAAGAGHLYALGCGLITILGVAWLGWETAGRWSAVLSAAVLAVSPGFVVASRAVEAEAPMMACSAVAVAAAARYSRTRRRPWLVCASLLLACGILSKLLALAVAAPIGLAIVVAALSLPRQGRVPRLLIDGALSTALAAAPVLLAFALVAPGAQYDQVIRFHLRASEALLRHDPAIAQTGHTFITFLGWDIGLLALAVVGMAQLALLRRTSGLIVVAWALATYLSMARYYPLFIHHLTVLLPPLAALAGGALAPLDVPGSHFVRRSASLTVLVAGLFAYVAWLPVTLDHSRHAFVRVDNPLLTARVSWLDAHTRPGEWVVVDEQSIAVAANRGVPPALADTSIVRNTAGYLPISLLEQQTADRRVRVVLLTRTLAGRPDYLAWLRRHFVEVGDTPLLQAIVFARAAERR